MEKLKQLEQLNIKTIIKDLEQAGYKLIEQKEGQETVEIEGQTIKLPFTNMRGLTAILRKENGQWYYLTRSKKDDLESELRMLHQEL